MQTNVKWNKAVIRMFDVLLSADASARVCMRMCLCPCVSVRARLCAKTGMRVCMRVAVCECVCVSVRVCGHV